MDKRRDTAGASRRAAGIKPGPRAHRARVSPQRVSFPCARPGQGPRGIPGVFEPRRRAVMAQLPGPVPGRCRAGACNHAPEPDRVQLARLLLRSWRTVGAHPGLRLQAKTHQIVFRVPKPWGAASSASQQGLALYGAWLALAPVMMHADRAL